MADETRLEPTDLNNDAPVAATLRRLRREGIFRGGGRLGFREHRAQGYPTQPASELPEKVAAVYRALLSSAEIGIHGSVEVNEFIGIEQQSAER